MSSVPGSHQHSGGHADESRVEAQEATTTSVEQPARGIVSEPPQADEASVTKTAEEDIEEREEAKSLNEAALSIPDSEASDQSDAPTNTDNQVVVAANAGHPGTVVNPGTTIDWEGVLGHSASGLGAANAATSAYFSFARNATAFGLNVAKRVTQGIVAVPAFLADGALTGTTPGGTEPSIAKVAHSGIAGFFDAISMVAVGGIDITSAITSAGLGAAGSGVEGIRRALGSEVLRSLSEFSKLVKREWTAQDDSLPPGGIPAYSIVGITKALSTWVAIQMVTRKYQEARMLKGLDELDTLKLKQEVEQLRKSHQVEPSSETSATQVSNQSSASNPETNSNSDVRITSSQPMQGYEGNVIGAEIGHKEGSSSRLPGSTNADEPARPLTDGEAIHNLQRYSKLVLGVYGGMALYWLKGIPQPEQVAAQIRGDTEPSSNGDVLFSAEDAFMEQDRAEFLQAASQMELEDEEIQPEEKDPAPQPQRRPLRSEQQPHPSTYNLWDVVSGAHDDDLFHHTANLERGAVTAGQYVEDRVAAANHAQNKDEKAKPSKPRFYVVTDHPRKTIILVLRGTLSMGDVAADLTCESVPFEFAPEVLENLTKKNHQATGSNGQSTEATVSSTSSKRLFIDEKQEDLCHEGMYITAKEIGSVGRSVHRSVGGALAKNPGYSLDITGHSLGAGVSCVLAMMWADPTTGLTTRSSGLPTGRRVHAYCFAVPCVTNEPLAQKVQSIVTSYSYSYDLVCRLSLGAIQDIRNTSAWLCYQDKEAQHGPQTMNALMKRAFEYHSGRLEDDTARGTEEEFLVLRKTLEANMHNTHLFPPGKVLYSLLTGNDILETSTNNDVATHNVAQVPHHRLFRAKTEQMGALKNVFGQIIFSRNMLSSHMPNVYDDMLHSLAR